jgi:hypothetical protein
MGTAQGSGAPRWIVITVALVGLVTALFVAVAKYFEIVKAQAEASKAQAELVRNGDLKPARNPAETSKAVPTASNPEGTPPKVSTPADTGKPKPPPAFQPRSSSTTTLAVGPGKVEVTAKAVEERRVIITIVGRDFGNDLSPLQEWIGKTGDLFQRKLKELGFGDGTWNLVSNERTFTVRDGVASLELTWEQK